MAKIYFSLINDQDVRHHRTTLELLTLRYPQSAIKERHLTCEQLPADRGEVAAGCEKL